MRETSLKINDSRVALINFISGFRKDFNSELNSSQKENLSYLEDKTKNNVINFVVIGQFKRGKSTFINALLGEKILPAAILPVTSIIATVKFSKEKYYKVFLLDGNSFEIKHQEISGYISEQENKGNKKNVKYIEVGHPNPLLKKGVLLIDTPGIGSMHKNNTMLTYEYLPKVDAAIFITSPEPVLSETELNLLKELKNITDKTFFVLNKKDTVSENEINEVSKYILTMIKDNSDWGDINLYPVSAKKFLLKSENTGINSKKDSGIEEFKAYLEDYIDKEKIFVLINSVKRQFLEIISETENKNNIEKKLTELSLNDIKNKADKLKETAEKISKDNNKLFMTMKNDIDGISRFMQEITTEDMNNLIRDLKSFMKDYFDKNQGLPKEKFRNNLEKEFTLFIKKELDKIRLKTQNNLKNEILSCVQKYNIKYNSVINDIYDLVSKLFDINLNKINTEYKIKDIDEFSYLTNEFKLMFEPDLLFFSGFLTSKLHNKLLMNKYMKKAVFVSNINVYYITESSIRILNEFHIEFTKHLRNKIEEIISSVRDILVRVIEIRNSRIAEYSKYCEDLIAKSEKIMHYKNLLCKG